MNFVRLLCLSPIVCAIFAGSCTSRPATSEIASDDTEVELAPFYQNASVESSSSGAKTIPILSNPKLLKAIGIKPLFADEKNRLAYAEVTEAERNHLITAAHEDGKCGGFEALPEKMAQVEFKEIASKNIESNRLIANEAVFKISKRPEIVTALSQVDPEQMRKIVEWYSKSFQSRCALDLLANVPVDVLYKKLKNITAAYPDVKVEKIRHVFFWQKSIRVTLPGKARPGETLVFGAHLDSINRSLEPPWNAPGADDDASGIANLIEMLRILLPMERPDRTLEFHFYASEEIGMQGSAQIAKWYRKTKRDVVGEVQFDMTLHAGDGEQTIASYTDFTHPGMRKLLEEINDLYLNVKILDDVCGYGCSDHVSWFRNGFPALFPYESSEKNSNQTLHTKNDKLSPNSNFKHSALFTKLGLVFALELGNSLIRPDDIYRRH